MNYPFNKKKSPGRFLSLALVLALVVAMLSGCSLLPSSQNSETQPSEEATDDTPNIVVTDPPTEAPTEAPTQAPTTAPKQNIAIVKEQLNMRNSPSTGSRVVTELDAGDEVEVLRVEPIGTVTWAYVSSESLNVLGWIVTDMLDMSNVNVSTGGTSTPGSSDTSTGTTQSTVSTESTTPAPTVNNITGTGTTTAPANGKYGVVTASELNIRSSASQTADRVGSYKYGDRITVLESSNGWGRTDKGWISLSYVYMDGDVGPNAVYGTVTASELNVRSGPGTTYDRVKALSQNDRVQVLQQITVGGTTWGYVSGGWVSMDYVSLDGGNNTGNTGTGNTGNTGTSTGTGTGTVTGTAVNVRAGAGQSYQTVGSKTMGDVVTIYETVTAEGYTWGRIDTGWICMNYVRMN